MRIWGSFVSGLAATWMGIVGYARASDPSALWHIVNDRCVPHEEKDHDPSPCVLVNLTGGVDRGYAILKDIVGNTQFLLIPTARMAGMESTALLRPDAPNYWNEAWTARSFVDERAGRKLSRSDISLAVNSAVGRTQDQLHIHIDCVRADVKSTLTSHQSEIASSWKPFPVPLAGQRYEAIRIDGEDLGMVNPFRLLAEGDPRAASDMAHYTLAVVGMVFDGQRPGFVVLADHANLAAGDRASDESLQDHACEVAKAQ